MGKAYQHAKREHGESLANNISEPRPDIPEALQIDGLYTTTARVHDSSLLVPSCKTGRIAPRSCCLATQDLGAARTATAPASKNWG